MKMRVQRLFILTMVCTLIAQMGCGDDNTISPAAATADADSDAEGEEAGTLEDGPSERCTSNEECQEEAGDSNPCQVALCDTVTGSCSFGDRKDYTPCEDGSLCTLGEYCLTGACSTESSTFVDCNDDNPCTTDSCLPETGCLNEANSLSCDDGNPCTSNDACSEGLCTGTENSCPCTSNEECAAENDDNLCNGTLYCIDGACEVDPASIIECAEDEAGVCEVNLCNPATGACSIAPVSDGTPCEDGISCTVSDTCVEGVCAPGENNCDSCDTAADCSDLDDGNACNGLIGCIDGTCALVPDSSVECINTGDPCVTANCVPESGLCENTPKENGTGCNDGNACTIGDSCTDGSCQSSGELNCNDGDSCTINSCDPLLGCSAENICDETCGDGICGESEDCNNCSGDCGECPESCGDGTCDDSENCNNCSEDCGECSDTCGDGICDASENCNNCSEDCGECLPGCGDGICDDSEDCLSCEVDCGECEESCGDGTCDDLEDCLSCEADCGDCPPGCGDEVCGPGETCLNCPADCGGCAATCGDGTCSPMEFCKTCPTDCGLCPPECGDQVCDLDESCLTCPLDCGPCTPNCGDGECTAEENCENCFTDCGACGPECGDGTCSDAEDCQNCPADCGSCPIIDGCSPTGFAGCLDCSCEDCVCEQDSFCCDVEWDDVCVEICEECGGCEAGPMGCGNGTCDGNESCQNCPQDCGPCGGFTGCEINEGPGCDGCACEDCVCDLDGFCCDAQWDDICVGICAGECGECDFVCGDGDCQPSETCENCEADCGECPEVCGNGICLEPEENCDICPADCGECSTVCGDGQCEVGEDCASCQQDCGLCNTGCFISGESGCDGCSCESCVCDADPFCCDVEWDDVCVEICKECGADCPKLPDGCEALPGSGCQGCPCEECVCDQDPFCCEIQWDGICVEQCGNDCGQDCQPPAAPVCGDGTCDFNENCTVCAQDCGACPKALVRVIHVAPDAAEVDFFGNGVGPFASNVTYGEGTDSIQVNAGSFVTSFFPAGAAPPAPPLTESDPVNLAVGTLESFAIYGLNADLQVLSFSEGTGPLQEGQATLRFIHTAAGIPPVKVSAVPETGGSLDIDDDVTFGAATAQVEIPFGLYTLRLQSGNNEFLCALSDLSEGDLLNLYAVIEQGNLAMITQDENGLTSKVVCSASTCGDTTCSGGETCESCPFDCGPCASTCGNNECGFGENCTNCPEDCGPCTTACGNGFCGPLKNCKNCPQDCGPCAPACGDEVCGDGETCTNCPDDCGSCLPGCGNGECGFIENCTNCPEDCGACQPSCGNGTCTSNEDCVTCPADCGVCLPNFFCGNGNCGFGESCSSCPEDCGECPDPCGDGSCVGGEDCESCEVDCGVCPGPPDADEDGVPDETDNCINTPNQDQTDLDQDGQGDACDEDRDGDGVSNDGDNCPDLSNPEQTDTDLDTLGNACDGDDDNDGIPDGPDNCPLISNISQSDADGDGAGNECDPDDDNDGDPDTTDCAPGNPEIFNGAEEICGDGIDNNCDPTDGCGSVNGQEYTPVQGEEEAETFYDYGSGSPWTSSTGFEQSNKTVIVVYVEPDGTTSLLMTHDIINDGSPGSVQMTVSGAVGGEILFFDDPFGNIDNYTFNSATGEGTFTWSFGLSDGMIMGGFDGPFCVTFDVTASTGMDGYVIINQGGPPVEVDDYDAPLLVCGGGS